MIRTLLLTGVLISLLSCVFACADSDDAIYTQAQSWSTPVVNGISLKPTLPSVQTPPVVRTSTQEAVVVEAYQPAYTE